MLSHTSTNCISECWCDNTINSVATKESDSSCSMGCAADATEACGGPNLLTIYYANKAPPNPADAVDAKAIAPFTYQGCYTDASPSGRALANYQPDSDTLTVESCVAGCKSHGYSIAGMEYSKQCYCDNYIRHEPTLLADSKCNMACSGNSAEMCGAGNVLSIYANSTTLTPYVDATAQTTGLPGKWKYQGCLSDIDGARSLVYEIVAPTNNSNVNCLNQCAAYGYGAAGTEYGEQCFCGDVQNVIDAGATLQPESDCNMICSLDKNSNGGHICGGPSRLSYYTWTGKPLTSWSFATGDDAGEYNFLISGPVIPLVTSPARNGKVTYLEKFGTSPANNGTGAYEFDISLVDDYSKAWREMHVKSDIFCSASLTLPDSVGRQVCRF